MRLVVLLLHLGSEVLVVVDDGVEEAAADFLLCNGGLVVLVFAFSLLRTEGALACRASFVGSTLGSALSFELAALTAVVVVVLPGGTTPLLTDCFGWLVSGLVLRSLVFNSTPEFSLSAFRRAGFFLGFLVAVGPAGS